MRRDVQEGLVVLALAAIASFVPAMLMGDVLAALQFAFAFTLVLVLPLTPWVLLLERGLFEKLVFAIVLGIAGIPILFFFVGVFHGPMGWLTFLGIPALVFAAGAFVLQMKSREPAKQEHHSAHAAPSESPAESPLQEKK